MYNLPFVTDAAVGNKYMENAMAGTQAIPLSIAAMYNLPFVTDAAVGNKYMENAMAGSQAIPLSIASEPAPASQLMMVVPQAAPQIVYVQQMPVPQHAQQQQTVVIVPQPAPSVAGSDYGGSVQHYGFQPMQMVDASAPVDDIPAVDAYASAPPAYGDFMHHEQPINAQEGGAGETNF
eukprot:CAMPEP_0202729850 /NCGR_PEP_ID=MMETSP1385-20130828/186345_1 /ASSEMBLY_ACC=CAM_ASM_000861 /TAXON_ID=933848 /ORGANISM="Elphidium margaritaceum" /LENGTH=177 /DNA_ID=CAMNT_0049396121 /DNA_START=775 /DNA_END=1308 /DNA_ORIENTATION=-